MFIDDFFLLCILDNFSRVTDLCIKTNLVLNFEKCHFMVHEGIVLGHLVSSRGIEVDKAKIDVITSLPYPASVREVHSFLGHAGFYRRFIQDFNKIVLPSSNILQKNVDFVLNQIESFPLSSCVIRLTMHLGMFCHR